MATQEQIQEIANRGLQDRLSPERRAKFDELVRRGIITLPERPGNQAQADTTAAEVEEPGSILQDILGIGETGLAIGSAIVAEPAAGVLGAVKTITSGPEAGEEVIKDFREALTFQPRTEAGKENLQAIGEFLEPVGEVLQEAESGIGDFVFEKTGSPALSALATTIPTGTLEVLGFKGTQKFLKRKRVGKDPSERAMKKALQGAAPSIEQLFDTARAVFKEIDELGASVKPRAYQELVGKLENATNKAGLSKRGTTRANSILNEFKDLLGEGKTTIDPVSGTPRTSRLGRDVSLTELDDLRTQAQGLAKSIDPLEKGIGTAMIDTIDSFLDAAGEGAIKLPEGSTANIGKRYKVARQLWGRARRSEMIQEAFEKARRQASGFENGIRAQFRAILNNKKRSRFFTQEELGVMDSVVKGTKKQNFFKLIGRFGFSEGGATNVVGAAIGTAAGGTVAGTPGAVAVPIIGTISRNFAQRLTAKGAVFADDIIRSGRDGKKIVRAYLKHTPKGKRSAEELSQLLLKPDIDLNVVKGGKILNEAVQIAKERRNALAVAAGIGSAVQAGGE